MPKTAPVSPGEKAFRVCPKQVTCPQIGVDNWEAAPYHEGVKSIMLKAGRDENDDALIQTVSGILLDDGVMVYPTETYYGLGASCFSKKAVRRIYRLKSREARKPLPLVVSDLGMVEGIAAEPPAVFHRLASEFWPGPLTIVLKAAPDFPDEILGPGGTIAIRIPPVPWLRALIGELGLPITATSANISGEGGISRAEEAIALFNGKVDVIVDGGTTPGGKPSTIVDLSGDVPRIVREGAVSGRALEPFLAHLINS